MINRPSPGLIVAGSSAICRCPWSSLRTFSTSIVRHSSPPSSPPEKPSPTSTPPSAKSPKPANGDAPASPLAHAPRAYGPATESFTPTPLLRPIGLPNPPRAGENTGRDTRSLQERRANLVDYDKHLARRQAIKAQMLRPYFREWSNMRFHDGKTFVAPPRPFRADASLYFPNLHGRTLARGGGAVADTTPVLEGRTSVVAVFSSVWAEKQTRSFVSREANPALHEVLARSGGAAQLVQVNVEEAALKALLVRLFSWSLRRRVGRDNWDKYFVVRKGLTDEIREAIGLLNSKVGYTYLVDRDCKIRWAGSGPSQPEEREGLTSSVRRLLDEMGKQGNGGRGTLR